MNFKSPQPYTMRKTFQTNDSLVHRIKYEETYMQFGGLTCGDDYSVRTTTNTNHTDSRFLRVGVEGDNPVTCFTCLITNIA